MSKLKIAIQKSGRLNQDSLELLKDCGIKIDNGKDQLKVSARNFPLEVLYLRNSDIPQYIEDGVVDIAIIGENILIEKQKQAEVVEKLGFAKCRVSLAVPKRIEIDEAAYFNGKKIATSYPNTLQTYLKKNNIEADIHVISGSVEIAPNIGLADGVCDIVSSGSTLFKNGLRETQVILKSEAVLAKNRNLNAEKEAILEKLIFRIQAVLRAKNSRYVLMNVPTSKIDEVTAILPVLRSPTILPLAQEGWSSLHSVIEEEKFWNNIDALKNAGAEGILVVPIDKMVL
ncbi:ATP phosphoribosyltransferase [Winogradskyella psychrotolerans]|jgi:ATP phosphoribosyltransferase|uniref:ATP phosphoribosyltransferase n=1 Tax=Winogradskyella TaxID=286104 RepID=UPI001C075C5F|nr:ATP phosphoribosyltransferase [Winogradskyella psychrotolerans]MBU2922086.1 ATP phosphoribosyltransferase [Winogradskyella psychrotolerans]